MFATYLDETGPKSRRPRAVAPGTAARRRHQARAPRSPLRNVQGPVAGGPRPSSVSNVLNYVAASGRRMMRAAVLGLDGSVTVQDVEPPVAAPDQLLVRVRAAGLNRADLAARASSARAGPAIAGLE